MIKKAVKTAPKASKKPVVGKKKAGKPNKPKPRSKAPIKLIGHLENQGAQHNMFEHKTVYTAFDAAMTLRRDLKEIAKSLLVKADKEFFLVLLPADHNLDLKKLEAFIAKQYARTVKAVKIPPEEMVQQAFKLKNESMSAFGSVHKLPVVMERTLTLLKSAVFSSGSFNHSIEMKIKDYMDLEKPAVGAFGVKKKIKLPRKNSVPKKKTPAGKKQKAKPSPTKKKK